MNSLHFPASWRLAEVDAVSPFAGAGETGKVPDIHPGTDPLRTAPRLYLEVSYANLIYTTDAWERELPCVRYIIATIATRHWSMDGRLESFVIPNERLQTLCDHLSEARLNPDYAVFATWCEFDDDPSQPLMGESGLDVRYGVRFPDALPAGRVDHAAELQLPHARPASEYGCDEVTW